MQHKEHTQIVLTIYTALCSLHKTANEVLLEKQIDDYTCVQAFTPRYSMWKFYKHSMMKIA